MKDLAKIQEFFSKPLGEIEKEDKVDTITMDIPLFLRMLEYSREDASQDMDLHDVTEKANLLGKERGILQMDDYDEIVGAAEDKIKEAVNLKASKLSATEYQKAKKLKDFKASDWKYDSKEDLYTKVNEVELSEINLKKGDIVKFANGKKFYIISPRGDGYEYVTDDNQRSWSIKGWFDMMVSSGKATIESQHVYNKKDLTERVINRLKNDPRRTKR